MACTELFDVITVVFEFIRYVNALVHLIEKPVYFSFLLIKLIT